MADFDQEEKGIKNAAFSSWEWVFLQVALALLYSSSI